MILCGKHNFICATWCILVCSCATVPVPLIAGTWPSLDESHYFSVQVVTESDEEQWIVGGQSQLQSLLAWKCALKSDFSYFCRRNRVVSRRFCGKRWWDLKLSCSPELPGRMPFVQERRGLLDPALFRALQINRIHSIRFFFLSLHHLLPPPDTVDQLHSWTVRRGEARPVDLEISWAGATEPIRGSLMLFPH